MSSMLSSPPARTASTALPASAAASLAVDRVTRSASQEASSRLPVCAHACLSNDGGSSLNGVGAFPTNSKAPPPLPSGRPLLPGDGATPNPLNALESADSNSTAGILGPCGDATLLPPPSRDVPLLPATAVVGLFLAAPRAVEEEDEPGRERVLVVLFAAAPLLPDLLLDAVTLLAPVGFAVRGRARRCATGAIPLAFP